jgi:hypothetical protein
MIFCSVVMVSSNAPRRGASPPPTAPRPASARDSPWGQDTSVRLSCLLISWGLEQNA